MATARCMRNLYVVCCLSVLAAACSNGRGSLDSEPAPPSGGAQEGFTVGGTITGLDGNGLVLQNNGGSDLAVSNNGIFTFTGGLANAAAYNVTVLTQPSGPSQTCTVGNGSGTIASGNVTNIAVTCATGAFALRGTVTGLVGSGLTLQNDGGEGLPIAADGAFSFPTPLASGTAYNVVVQTHPSGPSQTCMVANGSGTIGSADVDNVAVTCATGTFVIGGSVSGLVGSGLELQNNGGDDLRIGGNGTFQFERMLTSGASYNVTVKTHPTNPTQSCTVTNGAGNVGSASVMNVAIACVTNRFTIGGTVSGLSGSGLVLQLNGGNDFQIKAGGVFAFPLTVPSTTQYLVTVKKDPSNPTQSCSVANGIGMVSNANITNIAVSCVTNQYSIGGTVENLEGSGLVLQKNGADDLAIASDGNFTFRTEQASATEFRVTVRTQPTDPSQTCTVANGAGRVGSGDVRNVKVTCSTNTFSVGGTVSGLLGSGLQLQNGGDNLDIGADGSFQFQRELASGATYSVSVRRQPSDPTQACTVENSSGTVGAADVTSVVVSCSTSNFMIGGSVNGLAGSGLLLQNNGGDNLELSSGGGNTFAFPAALPSGATYNVTIAQQPTNPVQACTVTNASGTVGSDNVTSVVIDCTTVEFSVGGSVSGLSGTTGLVLQNNGGDDLAIATSTSFTFPTSLPNGALYNVTVATQPSNPAQTCLVTNGIGAILGADVTAVQVDCADDPLP